MERTTMIDATECDHARLARDPAYDGRFYTGVRTTRIYCRPVCPVRPAQSRNVRFYPSAAAAEADGFRPCLRCRPETAPFSPAWNGSRTTVARGLRLIVKGALDGNDASVVALAAKLGVGERHLARLFIRHLGASPSQVARTARVQRAKRLLDTTERPMSQIALDAGFGSLRRIQRSVCRGLWPAANGTAAANRHTELITDASVHSDQAACDQRLRTGACHQCWPKPEWSVWGAQRQQPDIRSSRCDEKKAYIRLDVLRGPVRL